MIYKKVSVDIEEDLITRFREIYPQHGATKWFFNECLRIFCNLHDHKRASDEIRQTVEEALNSIGGE